jgi:16S rRNA (cytosine1402-N4)-methyltransferase
MSNTPYHIPVLLHDSIDGLAINPAGVYVDVTFGGGGHSKEILNRLGPNGKLFAFDQDKDALANVPNDKRFTLIQANFRFLTNFLKLYGITQIDGLLADLGVSSHQFDDASRGFSIRFSSDLDMRMNTQSSLSAKTIINEYEEERLIYLFKFYGELPQSKRMAETIIMNRKDKSINTTAELMEILGKFTPKHIAHKFFAQVFQALRIEVNDEMKALEELLTQITPILKTESRLSVISYHSLEDRLVKNFIRSGNIEGNIEKDFFGKANTPFNLIARKPIIPSDKEINENTRARSAKLRIAEKK